MLALVRNEVSMSYIKFTDGLYYLVPRSTPNDGSNITQGNVHANLVLGKLDEVWTKTTESGVTFSCNGAGDVTLSKTGMNNCVVQLRNGYTYAILTVNYNMSKIQLAGGSIGQSGATSSGTRYENWFGVNGDAVNGTYHLLPDFLSMLESNNTKNYSYINLDSNEISGTLVWRNESFPDPAYMSTYIGSWYYKWYEGNIDPYYAHYTEALLGDVVDDGYSVTYDLDGCTGDSGNPAVIAINATITNMSFTPDSGYAFNSGSCWIDGDGYPSGTPIEFVFDSETGGLRIGPISSNIVVHVHSYIDPYNNPDNPDLIDGEDEIPNADTISVPSLPGIGATSSGMIGLFNPTASQMQLLADYMWTDFGGTGSTTEDILKEIVQAIKRSISNPLDYVIGLNIIPSQGLSVGSSTSVRFGFVNSNVSMPRLTSQYFVVDCGSLSFDKLCGDTFLDYAPYSKFSLYLPYIGVKEMDANDFVGHTISILYHGDVVTGGVTAYVLKDGSVMYQYSGCCALTVPLSADSWGNTISGAIQIATTLIGGHALSSAGKGFPAKRAGIMSAVGAANIASNPSLLSPQVMRSGAISGGAGCMASQKPFVIREAVRFHTTEGYNTITGYPSYYYKPLSSMHGFTSVLDVHLHGIPGTHQELAEIEDLLKEGVIL